MSPQKASSGIEITSAHDARQDQPFDRVEPDRAHGIDLLVDLHGADLGREGAARAARDDDRGQQHAQLAEHADADGLDGEGLGAELAELLDALVGDHHADQEAVSTPTITRARIQTSYIWRTTALTRKRRGCRQASTKTTRISPKKAQRLTICL